MRRGAIGIVAVVAIAGTVGIYAPHGSALDRPAAADRSNAPQMPVTVAAPAAAAPSAPTQPTEPNSQSMVESTGTAATAALGSVVSTGWQMALGAYYLGGEFLETGRIMGTQAAGMLGIVSIPTEPAQPAGTRPAGAAEDSRLTAWTGTGNQNHTPSLETPATMSVPTIAPPGPQRSIETVAMTRPATEAKAVSAPQVEKASIAAASTTAKPGPRGVAGPCTWPGTDVKENRDSEAATLERLTELGLMSEPAVRLPDGSVFMPKVGQRLLQIRTGVPCTGGVRTSRTLVGHVIADPTASGLVQSSQDGRIEATEWGLPRLGQRVTAGEILGYLRPIWSNRERSAMEAEISTLRGDVAEKELELARSRELPLLPFREGRILSIRLELDKLRRHRDALIQGLEGAEPIIASANGVIARADARIGQVVEARHLLWEIVDDQRLWVEADWYGGEPPAALEGASATRSDGSTLTLAYEGSGWAMNVQSTPLQFRVERPSAGMRVGERVTVLVSRPVEAEGVLVPRSALVRRGNGETGVWAATSAERFEPVRVRWKAVDGSTVAIEAGLPKGARVVISGATLLSEVR